MVNKSIIFFTDSQLDEKIAKPVRKQLEQAAGSLPIVSCSLKPLEFGANITLDRQRGYLTMFIQILAALEYSEGIYVFFCEHDVLYPKEHFNFIPPRDDTFYYDHNWWKVGNGDKAVHWDADQVSGLCCNRKLAIEYYTKRIATFDPEHFDRKFEPMSGTESKSWRATVPHIDIRHGQNLTKSKWSVDDFRDKSTCVNWQESTTDQVARWANLGLMLK